MEYMPGTAAGPESGLGEGRQAMWLFDGRIGREKGITGTEKTMISPDLQKVRERLK